jgi:hypothetical protein
VLKPPELAPLTLLQLGEGLSQGVLNIIPGLAPLPQLDLDFHKTVTMCWVTCGFRPKSNRRWTGVRSKAGLVD